MLVAALVVLKLVVLIANALQEIFVAGKLPRDVPLHRLDNVAGSSSVTSIVK
jgi:hypothetical protein